LNRFWTRRRHILFALLTALLVGVSGCTGGARATSWTGLTIVDGTVYAADLDKIVALDAATGETLWTFPQDPQEDYRGLFQATPTVGEGYVIAPSQVPPRGLFSRAQNVVWAFNPATGADLWAFRGASGPYIEGGAVSGGLFVIGNNDGNVYALDVQSGELVWKFKTGHRVWATPLIVSDTVYIGSMDRDLYALNLADGAVRWKFHTPGAFASVPVLCGDTLFIGAFDDQLYAVDANTGDERWHFAGANWFWGRAAVYSDTVYAVDVSGNVYAISAASGTQIWHRKLGDTSNQKVAVRAGPAVAEDGSKLFVCGQNGALYALDTADGFVLWSAQSEGQALSTPVVSGTLVYETLILGTERIRVLHAENGYQMWAYPPETTGQQ
jgi:outer membrane protein assembly factor BamB